MLKKIFKLTQNIRDNNDKILIIKAKEICISIYIKYFLLLLQLFY